MFVGWTHNEIFFYTENQIDNIVFEEIMQKNASKAFAFVIFMMNEVGIKGTNQIENLISKYLTYEYNKI